MAQDIRKTEPRSDPRTGPGGGAAYDKGYGAGGLGAEPAGAEKRTWGLTDDEHDIDDPDQE